MNKIISQLKASNRFNITILLAIMSIFCFGLSLTRYFVTGTRVYLFLNWNLFLAFIPWFISTLAMVYRLNQKWIIAGLVFSWLLFFPNSPYILTDLIHLRVEESAPIWFDIILILSFAWAGLFYGFISLMDIEEMLGSYLKKSIILFVSIGFLFLAGFGIYLGRFLRWNSWDLFSKPSVLFLDIFDRIANPFAHPRTWGFTLLIGVLLNLMYFSLKFLNIKKV